MAIQPVYFGSVKVQALGRVALSEPLRRNLGIHIGESVQLEFDIERHAIVIRKVVESQQSDGGTKNV